MHRGDWLAHAVHLQVSREWEALALKYLGIHNILSNTSSTQLDILCNGTERLALRMATKRASVTVD